MNYSEHFSERLQ